MITATSYHIASGHILSYVQVGNPGGPPPLATGDPEIGLISDKISPSQWISDGVPADRETADTSDVPREILPGAQTIGGWPAGAWVRQGNSFYQADASGQIALTLQAVRTRFELAGRFQGDPVDIRVADLDTLKALACDLVMSLRDKHEWAGCGTPSGRVDTDPTSQRKVNGSTSGAIIAKAAGAPFSVDWTLADNSILTVDADAMIGIGLSVLTHVAACQDISTALKAAIRAAVDVEAINAVNINEGWPA